MWADFGCDAKPNLLIDLLVGAAWLMPLNACRVVDAEVSGKERPRTAANPRLAVAVPSTDGASNLSDVPILPKSSGRRHVILMIGDGMNTASEVAASRYLFDTDWGLSFHSFPAKAYKTTWDTNVYDRRADESGAPLYSPDFFEPKIGYDPARGGEAPYPIGAESPEVRAYFGALGGTIYPDSASTGTAMSTGIKTYSSAIAWRPDGGDSAALETSPQLLRRFYGMVIGFVTTVPFSHATPAAFFSHNPSRLQVKEIANEMLNTTRPEVMIGGGWQSSYYASADLNRAVASNEFVLTHSESGLDGNDTVLAAAMRAKQEGKRLVALYGGGQDSSFPSPVATDSPGNAKVERPSIGAPTLANASVAALEVLSGDPDGFLLLIEQGDIDWANHAHDYARMVACVADLDAAVRDVVAFIDRPNDDIDWSNTTLMVTADHANGYLRFARTLHQGYLPKQVGSSYPDGEVSYNMPSHTSELVSVYAKGFAAARLQDYMDVYPGLQIIDDTSIYRLTLDAARR